MEVKFPHFRKSSKIRIIICTEKSSIMGTFILVQLTFIDSKVIEDSMKLMKNVRNRFHFCLISININSSLNETVS